MTRTIDVVIPVRDNWALTESCLEHLRAQTAPHTVIICDNGSSDGTPARVRASWEARIIELGANLGFSAACNRGVLAGNAEIVVLLNNDVDCRHDFLERLVAPFDRDERLGSVAPILLNVEEETIESFGLAVDPTLAGYPRLRGLPTHEAATPDAVLIGPTGAAAAYRRQAWEEVGGLDEGVFSYVEDVDLAVRLRVAGWSTTGARDAVAVHVGSASAGRRSSWQRYQGGFARAYFLRRYDVLRSRAGPRAVVTEAIVSFADALVFSHDLSALRGRVGGWQAAAGKPRNPRPPREAIDFRITFLESLRRRFGVFIST